MECLTPKKDQKTPSTTPHLQNGYIHVGAELQSFLKYMKPSLADMKRTEWSVMFMLVSDIDLTTQQVGALQIKKGAAFLGLWGIKQQAFL